MASKRTKSLVWEHFERNADNLPQCNHCQAVIKTKDGATTNLHNHLNRKHKIKLEQCPAKNAKLVNDDSSSGSANSSCTLSHYWTKLTQSSTRHKAISQAIAKAIVLDLRPLDTVNDKGFINLIKVLEPRYELQSRTHITQTTIPAMFQTAKEKVRKILDNSQFIGLSTDGWTSRAARSYNTITAHVITDKWQMLDFVISTTEMHGSHTAENLTEDLQHNLEKWGINLSNTSITTDNAANIVLAIEKCNPQPMCHVRCMAHVLNLSTRKGLEVTQVQRLLSRVRKVVQYFHKSPLASNVLRRTLSQLEMQDLRPIIDVTTRWNSSYDMVERYLHLYPAISATLGNCQLRKQASARDLLSEKDVKDLEALRDVCTSIFSFFIYVDLILCTK